MADYQKCEKCGSKTEHRIEGSTEGIFCTKCEWAIVTTYIPNITQDTTQYKVFLTTVDFKNKDHVRAVSKVINKNLIQSRKVMQEKRPMLFKGEAIEVDKVRNILKRVGIKYKIEPAFPY